MILFFYNLALILALIVTAPWTIWQIAATSKYRHGLLYRLGIVPRDLGGAGSGRDSRPMIWIHAVSVGEVISVSRLVKTLDGLLPDCWVAVSTTTRTGQNLARERFGGNRVFYCPLDLPWAVNGYLNKLRPAMLVLAETEFWPNLLDGCARRAIPVVVVNARISDRSWPKYWRLRGLWRPFLSRLSRVLAQSELDAERLRTLGCERVSVAGNMKFDVRASRESAAAELIEAVRGEMRLAVAGSTLDGEEARLLKAWAGVVQSAPDVAMVLAPRHPERFAAVAGLLERSGHPWRRRSAIGKSTLAMGEIVLLDSMGELASVYSLASVAFVGGSLVAAGGHNPLEPAQFGVPVVMGEHYANFRAIVNAMILRDAILTVKPEELEGSLISILRDRAFGAEMGDRGRRVFEEQAGATERTAAVIQTVIAAASRPAV